MNYSHVIWTTYNTWQPHEKRGAWNHVADFYDSTPESFLVTFSKPLETEYLNKPKNDQKVLTNKEQEIVRRSILDLVDEDRVAGGLPVLALGINNTEVHLLIKSTVEKEKQKLSRLKSKSSSLLLASQEETGEIENSKIWAKGFWSSEFTENEEIFKLKQCISRIGA